MKKLVAGVILGVCLLWCTAAFADYASLGDDGQAGPYWGVGGLFLSGDDAAGANQTDFLPTVNVSGVSDMWAWQIFYGFNSDATAWGGSLDYIVADNWDECDTCESDGTWWFGIGATAISYNDLFSTAGAGGVDDTDFGPNVGFGWQWDEWQLGLYAHYLMSNQSFGAQATLGYWFD